MNTKQVADLSVLLAESTEAYYWMGFLIADGHFYKKGAIKLHLAEYDRQQLEKFKLFVKYTGKAKTCAVNVMNPLVVDSIVKKFRISNRKTYDPCDLTWMLDVPDLLFAFVIGIIDGDGHLAKRKGCVSSIAIKLHKNWFNNLKFIEQFLYEYFHTEKSKRYRLNSLSKITKSGYAQLMISDTSLISSIKQKSIQFGLPFMERKWELVKKVDCRKDEIFEERWLRVKGMLDSGMSRKEIANIEGLKYQTLNMFIWRKSV